MQKAQCCGMIKTQMIVGISIHIRCKKALSLSQILLYKKIVQTVLYVFILLISFYTKQYLAFNWLLALNQPNKQ